MWPVNDKDIAVSESNANNWKIELKLVKYFQGNYQFLRNIYDYHYVKFNWFCVKIKSVQYIAYSGPAAFDEKIVSIGVNNMMFDKYPFYACTNIEQRFDWGAESTPQSIDYLSQYPGTKTITPTSKKPIAFLWKVPQPWRQYVDCGVVRGTTTDSHLYGWFEAMLGTKNIRSPTVLYGGHPNWWHKMLPHTEADPSGTKDYVYGNTILHLEFTVGCTFRGRKVMGAVPITDDCEISKAVNSMNDKPTMDVLKIPVKEKAAVTPARGPRKNSLT